MKRATPTHSIYIFLIIMLLAAAERAACGEPYCNISHYDESDGLSQRSGKKIVTDTAGMIWIATWNGLNRFDSQDFAVVRPGVGESARRYSSRYRDLQAMADGSVWCRIDDRVVRLDPAVNRFTDIHTMLEEQLGRQLEFTEWSLSADSSMMVMKCGDIYLTLDAGGNLISSSVVRPDLKYASLSNRRIGDYPDYPYADQAYGQEDQTGGVWIVTRDGKVAYAPQRGERAEVIADMEIGDGKLRYSSTDADGGVWFCSNQGIHRVEMGIRPYGRLKGDNRGRILAACRDSNGHVWVAEPDRNALALYTSPLSGNPQYIDSGGEIHGSFTTFGRSVYSLAVAPDGKRIWAGCKPQGLFRLTPEADGYDMEKIMDGYIYDLSFDSSGCLWIATLGSGLWRIDNPQAEHPEAFRLPGLPEGTDGARRLSFIADSLLLVSTTGGLLAINPLTGASHLHVTETDRLSSLGCIAVTDAVAGSDGPIYVATESGGVSRMSGDPMGEAKFTPLSESEQAISDVVFALQTTPDGALMSVSPGQITVVWPGTPGREDPTLYSDNFWKSHLRFTEMRPFDLGDNHFLLGTYSGGIVTRLDSVKATAPKVIFTSASVQGRSDTLLTHASESLVLGRDQRSLTLRFSVLDFSDSPGVLYSIRINGGQWSSPSRSRTVSLYDLAPGRYDVDIRATDHFGHFDGSFRRLTVTVTPRWHETVAARIIFWLLGALLLWGIWRVWSHIRAIKHRQREILAAYQKLIEQSAAPSADAAEEKAAECEKPGTPEMSEADREFMEHVMDYVRTHIADTETGVDDMAAAVGVSRSGLTRRMKSLMGVSPADFIRRSRLKRAGMLLASTEMPVKEIAFDCGFADLNYFSKCFKSIYGVTPTGWRRGER